MKDDPLRNAFDVLLSRCDGATSQDGAGYNKTDADFSNSLVRFNNWSKKQRVAVHKMLCKYKKQLKSLGISYDAIPSPEKEEETFEQLIEEFKPKFIDIHEDRFKITFPFDWDVVNAVKRINGRRFDKETKVWTIPQNVDSIAQLEKFATKHKFGWADAAKSAISAIRDAAKSDIKASHAESSEFAVDKFGNDILQPYPFQKAGIEYAIKKNSVMIGDEMGLGKTIQAMGVIEHRESYPALILCPSIVKVNWMREIQAWLPHRTVQVVNGGKTKIDYNTDFVVMNYDIVFKRQDEIVDAAFQSLVADESHYLKNGKSKRGRAVVDIVYGTKTKKVKTDNIVPVKILMSGTPVPNRPFELVNQLRVLGKLSEFGGFGGFTDRYCDPRWNRYGMDYSGAANIEELNVRMREKFLVRRKKTNVLKELPDKIQTVIGVKISNKAKYNKAAADIVKFAGKLAVQKQDFLDSIEDLDEDEMKKAISDYARSKERSAERAKVLVKIEVLKQVCVEGKMKSIKEWVENFLESTNEKLVIFAHHRDVVNNIADKFGAVKIMGGAGKANQEAIDEFQNGETRIIVCSMMASGVGITLTASSNVLFVEQGWNPAQHDQASDRCHRIGQKNAVNVYYMNGVDTIDDWVYELIERKRVVVDGVTDGIAVDQDGENMINTIIDRLSGTKA